MWIIFFAVLIIALTYKFYDKEIVRIEWKSLGGFIAFLVLDYCIAYLGLLSGSVIDHINVPPQIDYHSLIWVWWEDAVFVLPFFYFRNWLTKYYYIALWVLFSLVFGYFHLYQGYIAMGVASLYPFLISYRYGKKFGMGTVMVAHIIFDFSQLLFAKLYPLLI